MIRYSMEASVVDLHEQMTISLVSCRAVCIYKACLFTFLNRYPQTELFLLSSETRS